LLLILAPSWIENVYASDLIAKPRALVPGDLAPAFGSSITTFFFGAAISPSRTSCLRSYGLKMHSFARRQLQLAGSARLMIAAVNVTRRHHAHECRAR
jgi:hypothetical protein